MNFDFTIFVARLKLVLDEFRKRYETQEISSQLSLYVCRSNPKQLGFRRRFVAVANVCGTIAPMEMWLAATSL